MPRSEMPVYIPERDPLWRWVQLKELDKELLTAGQEKGRYRAKAYEHFTRSGAHCEVDSIADVLQCLKGIQAGLCASKKP